MRLPSVLLLPFLAAPAAADVVTEGFQSTPLPQPGSVAHELSNGELLTYDGSTVARHAADGTFLETLFVLPGTFFTGAFAVNPSETLALVGESSNGELYALDLALGGAAPLGPMANNFTAVFDSETTAIVSAATCGFGCGNELIRVDLATGDQGVLANVPGFSGPLALADDGDLFYGVTGDGPTRIVRFDGAQLDGATLLEEGDAMTVVTDLAGASGLVHDVHTGRLYVAENSFTTGSNRLLQVDSATGQTEVLVEGDTFNWIAGLQFIDGAGPGVVAAFQPETTGHLVYTSTDFATFDDRLALAPRRATLDLSGAGTGGGAGPVTAQLVGGPANGLAVVGACPLDNLSATESAYFVGSLPLILSGLDPATTSFDPFVVPLDATGASTQSFSNNAGLVDVFALQAFLVDAAGAQLLATSTTATL